MGFMELLIILMTIETYTDENGNTKINLVEMRGSDSFDFSPNVSFITDKEANRPG